MGEKAGDDLGLAELERDLRFRIASGQFDEWIEAGVHLHTTPPWYEPGLHIARLRLRKRDGDLATHARELFNELFGSLEARLTDARMGERCRDDPVEGQFAKIRSMVSPGTSQPERTFVMYVLNAPSMPAGSEMQVAEQSNSAAPAECDERAPEEIESEVPPKGDRVAANRAALLTTFKTKGRELDIHITDEMVAKAAKPGRWNGRTMVTWWKRNDERCKPPHDKLIRAVLDRDPSTIWSPKREPKRPSK